MSFLHGAITASRFLVDGPDPAVFDDGFLDGINARAFDDTRELGDGDANVGFVVAGKLFDTEVGLEDVLVNQFIRLGVRIDTKSVPVTLLQAHCQIEEAAYRKSGNGGRGKSRLSRKEKNEIRETVRANLLRETEPKSKLIEVVWDTAKGECYIDNTVDAQLAPVVELLGDVFEIELLPCLPFLLASRGELVEPELVETLESVDFEPANFIPDLAMITNVNMVRVIGSTGLDAGDLADDDEAFDEAEAEDAPETAEAVATDAETESEDSGVDAKDESTDSPEAPASESASSMSDDRAPALSKASTSEEDAPDRGPLADARGSSQSPLEDTSADDAPEAAPEDVPEVAEEHAVISRDTDAPPFEPDPPVAEKPAPASKTKTKTKKKRAAAKKRTPATRKSKSSTKKPARKSTPKKAPAKKPRTAKASTTKAATKSTTSPKSKTANTASARRAVTAEANSTARRTAA